MVEIKFGAQQIIFMWKSIVKRHDIQVGIELSQDLLARASQWVSQYSVVRIIQLSFQITEWFSEKSTCSLNYRRGRLQTQKNFQVWCLLYDDLAFRDFRQRKFPAFSGRGDKSKYFEILILNLFEFLMPARDFSISLYFSTSENAVSDQLFHLKFCEL